MILQEFFNYDEMSDKASILIAKMINKVLSKNEICTVALSGGSSPKGTYRRLAFRDIDWNRVFFAFVDERNVPDADDKSNFKMIDSSFFKELNIQSKNILKINALPGEPEKVAEQYERLISNFFKIHRLDTDNGIPIFDIMILGMGPDGHTASLFPGSDSLKETKKIVINTEAPEAFDIKERITFTMPVLNSAKNTIFIVSGKDKKDIITSVMKNEKKYPASLVNNKDVLFSDFDVVDGGLYIDDL